MDSWSHGSHGPAKTDLDKFQETCDLLAQLSGKKAAAFDIHELQRIFLKIEKQEEVEPMSFAEQYHSYIVSAMIGLICHITIVNLIAVMTLTYGIVRHSTSWALRLLCERRRLQVLQPPKGHNKNRGRRGAVFSRKVNADSNFNNQKTNRIDCSTYPYLLSLALSDLFIGIAIAPLQLDM